MPRIIHFLPFKLNSGAENWKILPARSVDKRAVAWTARKFGMSLAGIVKPLDSRLYGVVIGEAGKKRLRDLNRTFEFGIAGVGLVDAFNTCERNGKRLRRLRRLLMCFG